MRRQFSNHGRHSENHSEDGMALIMALLVTMIATAMVVASLALATHNGGQSAEQRNATAALHAADYGLQQELASLSASQGGSSLTPPSCTAINNGSPTLLPSTSLPAQWFSVSFQNCSTAVLTRTIISTGYALGEGVGTTPPTTAPSTAIARTVVAHVTLQPAGATSNGGYGFPDAITSLKGAGTGSVTSTSAFPLSVSGLSGNPVSIRADGPVSLSGGTLALSSGLTTNSLTGWDNVTLSGTTVTGNIASAKTVTLTNSTVTGNVLGTAISTSGSTVSGTSRVGVATLPTQPPVPSFPSPGDANWANWTALTGGSYTTACPTSGTLTGTYVLTASCTSVPSAIGTGAVAIIVNAAANLTITMPSNPGPGPSQLYLVVTNGNLTVTGSGVAVPVFAYASGAVTVGGTLVGQLVGGSIATNNATTLLAEPVSTTVSGTPTFPPDFAFPSPAGGTVPPLGFIPQINDEYLCAPGATTAC